MDKAIISIAYMFDGYGMAIYIGIVTIISGFLASLFGIEREGKGVAAGLRTHVLLSVGCSLLMAISLWAIGLAEGIDINNYEAFRSYLNYDASRVAAGIIAGIGFLLAGTIIKNGASVKGLTTAATLWIVAIIGMAVGIGFILEAIITSVVALGFLYGLAYVENFLNKRSPYVHIIAKNDSLLFKEISDIATNNQLISKEIRTKSIAYNEDNNAIEINIFFAYKSKKDSLINFYEYFQKKDNIYQVDCSYIKEQK